MQYSTGKLAEKGTLSQLSACIKELQQQQKPSTCLLFYLINIMYVITNIYLHNNILQLMYSDYDKILDTYTF